MNVDRLRRLLLLVPLARKHGKAGIPVAEALAALHLDDVNQLAEDAALLADVGQPSGTPDTFVDIYIEGDRVRVELPQGFLHPPRFTAIEAAALLAALKPLQESDIEEVAAVVEKLHAALPAEDKALAQARLLQRAARIQTADAPPFRDLLERAIHERKEVELRYFALASGEASPRRLEPRSVFLNGGRWYLAAWNPDKGEEHLYRLDRMSDVRIGTRCFGEHKGPPLDRYQLDRLYVPSGEEQEVELRFSPRFASRIVQEWGEIAQLQPDGSVTIRVMLAGGNYLLSWVLGYGGDAEILRPASLRDALAARVQELRARYAAASDGVNRGA